MSTGSLIGAVVGGVIGFFIGGPVGAFYGASIGFALGMAIDPMTPDMPSVGAPDQMTQVMSSTVGDPVSDLAGTGKITGHLLCYGKERAEPVYSTSSGGGGKGGSPEPQPQVTGHKYYMSWVLGIVAGPVDTLYAVYKGEDVVWEGELNCPASGGKETIVLSGVGSVDFYFGTADQAANSKVGEIISDATLNTPYRNMCWAFFDDCYIGEYNRTPTMKFIIKKIPEKAFSSKHEIQTYDCNPAHAMWYILHNLAGLPESWLHSADFAAVASTLWGESRGISVLFDRQQSALNYLESINNHIDNVIRYDTDGKFHPKLIRDDYTVGGLPLIDEDVMLEEPTFNRKSWIDTLNEMKVQYSEISEPRPVLDGLLYGAGYDAGEIANDGRLGMGAATPVIITTFQPVVGSQKFFEVVCGDSYTVARTKSGILFATGCNGHGQYGDGTTVNNNVLLKINENSWDKVSAGFHSTLALKSGGSIWGSGWNQYGELGIGHANETHSFTQETTESVWKFVATSGIHTLAIRNNGVLFGTGLNQFGGQLSQGATWPDRFFDFIQIRYDDGGPSPYPFDGSAWKFVSCGTYSSYGIKIDGTLWAAGSNGRGQLGLGDITTRKFFTWVGSSLWKSVSSAYFSTVAIKEDGTLWGTGYNEHGQLGLGDFNQRTSFVQIGVDTWKKAIIRGGSMRAIRSDDTLWGAGLNNFSELGLDHRNKVNVLTQEITSKRWCDVGGGLYHTMPILKS